jgi:hypothetical protein
MHALSTLPQGGARLPNDGLDIWKISDCDLRMDVHGFQCFTCRLSIVSVLGLQQKIWTSLYVHFIFENVVKGLQINEGCTFSLVGVSCANGICGL